MAVISGNWWPRCLSMAQHLNKENWKKNTTVLKMKVWGGLPHSARQETHKILQCRRSCSLDKSLKFQLLSLGSGQGLIHIQALNGALCGENVIFSLRCLK